jgi:hypothetical protein
MRRILTMAAVLSAVFAPAAFATDAYLNFDADGNIVVSGPFSAVIPKPPGARQAGPVHASPSFLDEQLELSTAGFFADDQFITVQVETTNAVPGTVSNSTLPVVEIAGQEFRARETCVDIDEEVLDTDDDPVLEFIHAQKVKVVPAMQAIQLVIVNAEGTAEGTILFMRNVPSGCEAMTPEFKAEFDSAFERFVQSITAAN